MTKDSVTTNYSYNILNQLISSSEPTRINGRNENVNHTYTYVEKFGKIFKQDIIVKTSVPKSFIQQYAQYGIDTQIFKSQVVTIPKEAMDVFNKLITAIKFVNK